MAIPWLRLLGRVALGAAICAFVSTAIRTESFDALFRIITHSVQYEPEARPATDANLSPAASRGPEVLSGRDFNLSLQFAAVRAAAYFVLVSGLSLGAGLIALRSINPEFRHMRKGMFGPVLPLLITQISVLLGIVLFTGHVAWMFFYHSKSAAWDKGFAIGINVQPVAVAMMWTGSVGALLAGTCLLGLICGKKQQLAIARIEKLCRQCGYPHTASDGPCPECGRKAAQEGKASYKICSHDRIIRMTRWMCVAILSFFCMFWLSPRFLGSSFLTTTIQPGEPGFRSRRIILYSIQPFFWMEKKPTWRRWFEEM